MTGYRRNFVAGGCFFFTVNLADRRRRLLIEHIDALRTALRETQRHHPFSIDAIVVLPDHLHTVWTLPERDADFSMRWRRRSSAIYGRQNKNGDQRMAGAPQRRLASSSHA